MAASLLWLKYMQFDVDFYVWVSVVGCGKPTNELARDDAEPHTILYVHVYTVV